MTHDAPHILVRRNGRENIARAYSSTEAIAHADDACARYVREHYPEFAAAGSVPAGAYHPHDAQGDERP